MKPLEPILVVDGAGACDRHWLCALSEVAVRRSVLYKEWMTAELTRLSPLQALIQLQSLRDPL